MVHVEIILSGKDESPACGASFSFLLRVTKSLSAGWWLKKISSYTIRKAKEELWTEKKNRKSQRTYRYWNNPQLICISPGLQLRQ